MPPGLIINSDDYGRTVDISRGIRGAHLRGLVTSTTTMMNMPSAVEDVKIALQEAPLLGLGVHLVLTSGRPLLPPEQLPSLTTPEGRFWKIDDFIERAPALDSAEAQSEWRAQIEKFIAAAGRKPTHLDSHHHSSYFTPGLFQAMLELAGEYDVPIRLPLAEASKTTMDGIPGRLATSMQEAAPRLLAQFQPRSTDGFFVTFYDEGATRDELIRILDSLPESGTFEIMCHPGYVDEAFARESAYAWQRHAELEVLTDPHMRAEIEKRGIQLVSFAQL